MTVPTLEHERRPSAPDAVRLSCYSDRPEIAIEELLVEQAPWRGSTLKSKMVSAKFELARIHRPRRLAPSHCVARLHVLMFALLRDPDIGADADQRCGKSAKRARIHAG